MPLLPCALLVRRQDLVDQRLEADPASAPAAPSSACTASAPADPTPPGPSAGNDETFGQPPESTSRRDALAGFVRNSSTVNILASAISGFPCLTIKHGIPQAEAITVWCRFAHDLTPTWARSAGQSQTTNITACVGSWPSCGDTTVAVSPDGVRGRRRGPGRFRHGGMDRVPTGRRRRSHVFGSCIGTGTSKWPRRITPCRRSIWAARSGCDGTCGCASSTAAWNRSPFTPGKNRDDSAPRTSTSPPRNGAVSSVGRCICCAVPG